MHKSQSRDSKKTFDVGCVFRQVSPSTWHAGLPAPEDDDLVALAKGLGQAAHARSQRKLTDHATHSRRLGSGGGKGGRGDRGVGTAARSGGGHGAGSAEPTMAPYDPADDRDERSTIDEFFFTHEDQFGDNPSATSDGVVAPTGPVDNRGGSGSKSSPGLSGSQNADSGGNGGSGNLGRVGGSSSGLSSSCPSALVP